MQERAGGQEHEAEGADHGAAVGLAMGLDAEYNATHARALRIREAGETEILTVPLEEQPRLRGAAALVNTPPSPRRSSPRARGRPAGGRNG
jgi:hypothetical protein